MQISIVDTLLGHIGEKEITKKEYVMLMKFYDRLVADKRFVAE